MLSIEEIAKASNGNLISGNSKKEIKKYCMDSRIATKDDFFIPLVGENVDADDYIIECVQKNIVGYFINSNYHDKEKVIKESIKINSNICIIEVNNSEEALYSIGSYNRQKHIDIPVIAVTGSVGKTSTREMIYNVLFEKYNILKTEKNYNSLIGVPFMLLKIENQDACVLETGISEFNEMEKISKAVKPDIAVITIIGTSHIGNFKTQENIFKEKSKIYSYLRPNGYIVINGDDKYLKTIKFNDANNINKSNIIEYSIKDTNNIEEKEDSIKFTAKIYDKSVDLTINALGKHNIYNALCAIKIGQLFKIEQDKIIEGIGKYRNFERRMQKITLANGCVLIDDAYNASYDSIISGLNTVNTMKYNKKIVVIGDILEQGEKAEQIHRRIGKIFKDLSIDYIYTYGSNSKYIYEEIKKYKKENVFWFNNKTELLVKIKEHILPDTLIYFKASNGMNFKELIDNIKEEN